MQIQLKLSSKNIKWKLSTGPVDKAEVKDQNLPLFEVFMHICALIGRTRLPTGPQKKRLAASVSLEHT